VFEHMPVVPRHVLGRVVKLPTVELNGQSEVSVQPVDARSAVEQYLPLQRWEPMSTLNTLRVPPFQNALDTVAHCSTQLLQDRSVAQSLTERQSGQ